MAGIIEDEICAQLHTWMDGRKDEGRGEGGDRWLFACEEKHEGREKETPWGGCSDKSSWSEAGGDGFAFGSWVQATL